MATKRPQGIVESDGSVSLFYQIVNSLYQKTYDELSSDDIYKRHRQKQILRNLQSYIDEADEDVKAWLQTTIPGHYLDGVENALNEIVNRDGKIDLSGSFFGIHRESIEAIATDTLNTIAPAMQGVLKFGTDIVNQASQQAILGKLIEGKLVGQTIDQIQKEISDILRSQGIGSLIDRGGKTWDLRNYGEMLARTKLTMAANQGVLNEAIARGQDLVQVSAHYGSCPLCSPWQNEVLSISGNHPKYESVETARATGLFHPNCRHRLFIYNNKFEAETQVWDTEQQKYVPYSELKANDFNKLAYDSTVVNNDNLFKYGKDSIVGSNINRSTINMEIIYKQRPGYGTEPFKPAQIKHLISDYVGGLKREMPDYLPDDMENYFFSILKDQNIKTLGQLQQKFASITASLGIPNNPLSVTLQNLVNNAYYSSGSKISQLEKLFIVDDIGNIVFAAAGSQNRVSIPSNIWGKVQGKILIHNHPDNTSFSLQDLITGAKLNVNELKLYAKDNEYTINKPKKGGWFFKKSGIEKLYNQANDDVRDEIKNDPFFYKNDEAAYDAVIAKFADYAGWPYSKSKRKK